MMRFASIIAAATFIAVPALAAVPTVSATLAAPTTKTEVVTDYTIWKCRGSTCTTRSNPDRAGSLSECRALVQEVGQVTSYDPTDHAFDSDRLAQCNGR